LAGLSQQCGTVSIVGPGSAAIGVHPGHVSASLRLLDIRVKAEIVPVPTALGRAPS
jgi:hypothetical protein